MINCSNENTHMHNNFPRIKHRSNDETLHIIPLFSVGTEKSNTFAELAPGFPKCVCYLPARQLIQYVHIVPLWKGSQIQTFTRAKIVIS